MNVHVAICLFFSWWCQDWTTFKEQHNKSYSDSFEEEKRMTIFYENQKKIAQHNALFTQGRVKHSVVMNKFGDLDAAEIKAMMNGFTKEDHKPSTKVHEATDEALPASVDWRTKGAVTPAKDQGECGSCWSFSATGSLEGRLFLKTGKLVSLSEQNLIDCSGDYGNHGCNGGLMDNAFQYYKDKGCLATEESYPYKAQVGTCQFSSDNVGGTDIGYVDVPSGDESALQSAVANIGPVSVAIDASNWSFHGYSGGVYDEPNCSSTNLDHGVLVVGYGTENGTDYWLVKNSWGPGWGLDGYIKMSRNSDNQCGVATTASYPNF